MGQYYMAYVEHDGVGSKFCPQNAVFMTRNGIDEPDGKGHSWDEGDPDSWGSCFSGLKLMEHSWLGNDFVNGVLESVWDDPGRVVWVGDYADDRGDFDGRYTEAVYSDVWGDDGAPELPFDDVPSIHESGFLVNVDRGEYVDLARYAEASGFTPKWGDGVWVVHPLPLLTAVGNGRGGGDYHGTNMDMVGAWAMDVVMFTEDRPSGMAEVDYDRVRFVED